MRFPLIFLIFISFLSVSQAQNKKILDHSVYDSWESLAKFCISTKGNIIAFEQNPNRGDGMLIIHQVNQQTYDTVFRARVPQISFDESWMCFSLQPAFDSIRQLKIQKKKEEDFPKDTAVIYVFDDGETARFYPLKEIIVPKKDNQTAFIWLDKVKKEDGAKDTLALDSLKPMTHKLQSEGTSFFVYRPMKKDTASFDNITDFAVAENGKLLLLLSNYKDSLDFCRIISYSPDKMKVLMDTVLSGKAIKSTVSHDGTMAAFLWSIDTAKTKIYNLMFIRLNELKQITSIFTAGIGAGYCTSESVKPWFSYSDKKLIFGVSDIPIKELKDSIPDDEKCNVDVWSWTDQRLQSQQLKELKKDKKASLTAVYDIKSKDITVLGSEQMRKVHIGMDGDAPYALGVESMKYKRESSWELPTRADYYVIDVGTGEQKLLIESFNGTVSISPAGKWLLCYNYADSSWYSVNTKSTRRFNLSAKVKDVFHNDENDMPLPAKSFSYAGWTKNDKGVIINAKYDLWLFDPAMKNLPQNITGEVFPKNIKKRYIKTEKHSYFLPKSENILLSLFDDESKDAGFAYFNFKQKKLKASFMDAYKYRYIAKAEKSDQFLFRKMNYREYSQLYMTDFTLLKTEKISNANSFQENYYWGRVEEVSFYSYNGEELDGLLYLPEEIPAGEKIPLLMYFYERYSDQLHQYYTPGPSRSVISFPFYNSNGYAVFIPDIVYRIGYPGQSAYDCVMAGVDEVLRKYPFIDSTRMGLQGQSWGGYQVAWLITRTNRFVAAMAGAPVSNMTSAYGGIRWSSGKVRQFQYEQTQSRIGDNLWNAFDLYVENSPLFGVPQIETPLLIMSNDGDGSVPWSQGIELFTALRRLDKVAWLLNYNKDAHNLMKWPNRVDLSIRMFEFFEHYLNNKAMPDWMGNGRSAIDK